MSTPTSDTSSRFSPLCSLGLTPLLMTGILRTLLTEHFAQSGNIEQVPLQDFLWQAGDTSKILIESSTRWTPTKTASRPAVILKRNAWQVEKLSIGDRFQGGSPDGFVRYAKLMVGSHTLFCMMPREGAAAEILAAEVYRELMGFAPVWRKALNLMRLDVVQIDQVYVIPEADETFVVPITIAYAAVEIWRIEQQVPVLQEIVFKPSLFTP